MSFNKQSVRLHLEQIEEETLSPRAALSAKSRGRNLKKPKSELCSIRPIYQHDRDRIVHSKAFRRLGDKTQVFLSPKGSHYSNRLTHTLEVSQIARTVARALSLNESLTEAIAVGHDLGHTPFGHVGERALNTVVSGGFRHERQSLRVVDLLAKSGRGLNLSWEVRNGIVLHSKGRGSIFAPHYFPATLEGEIVRLSDIIAYLNHDIDDAVRGGFLDSTTIPFATTIGQRSSERINKMVRDLIKTSFTALNDGGVHLAVGIEMQNIINELRDFMFEKVYNSPLIRKEFDKSEKIITFLFNYFLEYPDQLALYYSPFVSDKLERNITDFLASLTDSYAIDLYSKLFIPVRLQYPEFR
ncbi:deoxyguanosinetriphosphate triphosphohydrolase [bacterium]|nr:deoxyguanosinetriphosphate triphosphohydrolase [bacterium]